MIQPFLRRFFNSRWLLVALPLLLLPTLFLPLGNDQAIFARGGEFLFNGGVLYRDYLDQKPPLIFIYYGIAQLCFGKSDVGIRLFDILWQTGTMFSLMYVIKTQSGRRLYGIVAAVLYGLLYSSMGYSETMQCEAMVAPAIVWMLYLALYKRRDTISATLLRGGLAGLCFATKFPLGITLPILILWEYLENTGWQRRLSSISISITGFVIGVGIGLSPLFNPEAAAGYLWVMEYTRTYIGMIPLNINFVQFALKSLAVFMGDNISLAITTAIFCGVFGATTALRGFDNRREKLLLLTFFLFIGLLLSVIAERRFAPYHFMRIYTPMVIVAAFGIIIIGGALREKWYLSGAWKIASAITICMVLLFSPLPRVIKNIRLSYLSVTNPAAYYGLMQQDGNSFIINNDIQNVAKFIKSRKIKGRTFNIALNCSNLYRVLDERPFSGFTMPAYYYASITPKGAYDGMIAEVRQAKWVVIQWNDVLPPIYGHNKSSWECVRGDSVLYPYLTEHFIRSAEFGALYVYERKDSLNR